MSEKRRTFHVGREGATRPVVLYSTRSGFWRTGDGALFMHHGHTWLGPEGRRYKIEKWTAPHTDRTFTSLQSALNDWARSTKETEKKTPAQLDAEIAEVLAGSSTMRDAHATRAASPLRVGQRFDHLGHTYEIVKIGRDKDRTVQIARPHTDRFGKDGFIDHRSFPARDFDRQHLRPLVD